MERLSRCCEVAIPPISVWVYCELLQVRGSESSGFHNRFTSKKKKKYLEVPENVKLRYIKIREENLVEKKRRPEASIWYSWRVPLVHARKMSVSLIVRARGEMGIVMFVVDINSARKQRISLRLH